MPKGGDISELKVNQKAGPELQGSLKNVRQYFTASQGQWPNGHLFEFGFEQAGRSQDGASTGLAMAMLLNALFTGNELDAEFCVTGAISPEGQTTPVRGVLPKIEAARRAGMSGIVIPSGNERALADLILLHGPRILYQLEIIGAATVTESTQFVSKIREAKINDGRKEFAIAASYLKNCDRNPETFKKECLKAPGLRDRINAATRAMPNHLSAKYFRLFLDDRCPRRLSLFTSEKLIYKVYHEIKRAVKAKSPDRLGPALNRLEVSREILNKDAIPFADALKVYGQLWQAVSTAGDEEQKGSLEKIGPAARDLGREREILLNQPKVLRGIEE